MPDVAFTTDATGYIAHRLDGGLTQYRFTVISHFQNRSTVSVYLGRCFPNSTQPLFSVEAADGSAAESAYEQVWACVGHNAQFEVLPGATRTDTLTISGPNAFDHGSTVGRGVTSGKFQLYFDVRLAPGDGAPQPPAALRLSNAFLVQTDG